MRRGLAVLLALCVIGAGIAGLVMWVAPWFVVDSGPAWSARAVYPLEHARAIRSSAHRNHLDPALVAGVIYVESGFDDEALSEAGAIGLMQVLPETARQIARETGGVTFVTADLRDPEVNIRYGCYYLGRACERFGDDTVAVIAAYNAGMGAAETWVAEAGGEALRVSDIPYAETRAYVRDVLRARRAYRRAYSERLGLETAAS